jgi:hypothetical protein
LAQVFPATEETPLFFRDWAATVAAMTEDLSKLADSGTVVNYVSHDQIYEPDGNIYMFYFELIKGGKFVSVTLAWRFQQSYYVTLVGMNTGDMPDMLRITKEAARDFRDYTAEPLSGFETMNSLELIEEATPVHIPEWKYSVFNPFWAVWEQFYDEGGFYNPKESEAPIVPPDIPFDWGDQTPGLSSELIPAKEIFIERYDKAAAVLGIPLFEDLPGSTEERFDYEFRNSRGDFVAAIIYEPLSVWLIANGESERDRLQVFAAAAAGLTGLPAEECLAAMTDLVIGAQYDGDMYTNSAVLAGVPFTYELSGSPDSETPAIAMLFAFSPFE